MLKVAATAWNDLFLSFVVVVVAAFVYICVSCHILEVVFVLYFLVLLEFSWNLRVSSLEESRAAASESLSVPIPTNPSRFSTEKGGRGGWVDGLNFCVRGTPSRVTLLGCD